MSVAERFLRGGKPGTTVEALSKTLTDHYHNWCWVTAYPRQWHRDVRTNTVSAPAFHLLFGFVDGCADACVTSEVPHDGPLDAWHLLYATVQSSGASDAETLSAVRSVFQRVSPDLHPTSFSFVVCTTGHTHERLGLCHSEKTAWAAARMAEKVLDPMWALSPSTGHVLYTDRVKAFTAAYMQCEGHSASWSQRFHKEHDREESDGNDGGAVNATCVPCLPFAGAESAFVSLVRDATEWVKSSSGLEGATDASIPAQGDNTALLAVLATANPLLWQNRYIEESTAARKVSLADKAENRPDPAALSGVAKWKAERDAGREAWRASIGECTTFSLSSSITADKEAPVSAAPAKAQGEDASLDYRYGFLLQRPQGVKKEIDMDNRDPGPLTPQPIGAEVHLLPDPGDALHVEHQLSGEVGAMEFTYEDFLESEGEVLLQVGPVEGVPFDDLDQYLAFVDDPPTAAERPRHLSGRCEGSCSELVFPRVLFRKPTGKSEKLNPMTKSHAQIVEQSPTSAMLTRAAEALALLSTHVCALGTFTAKQKQTAEEVPPASVPLTSPALGKAGYTLLNLPAIDESVLGPPSRRCGWCMRRRERLLRCGACKAVYYCSKAHQATDWKDGTHRTDCALLQRGKELEETVFAPLVNAMSEEERVARTAGWSCGGTLVNFLCSSGIGSLFAGGPSPSALSPDDGEIHVHVVGVEAAWVGDLAQRLSQLLPCSREQGGDVPRHLQLRLTVFVDQASNASSTVSGTGARGDGSPHQKEDVAGSQTALTATKAYANNTILAVRPAAPAPSFVEVPATGVVGDVWHVKGSSAAADRTEEDEAANVVATAFEAARVAPILLRVCNMSYFRFIEGSGGDAVGTGNTTKVGGRQGVVRAVMYVGPSSGEGLGYLYGSLDTVARLMAGSVPLRFVDSSYIGSHRSAGALLARLDTRKDALGVSVREALAKRWDSMTAKKKKGATATPASGGGKTGDEQQLAFLNIEHFAVSDVASTSPAPYVNSFCFDVPIAGAANLP